jgi:hypothetical protein
MTSIEDAYEAAGVELPMRRFTAVGNVASAAVKDCEQVTVNFVQGYLGLPGQPDLEPKGCLVMMSGDFVIQVVRCVPTVGPGSRRDAPKPPTVAQIEESTLVQAIDAQILLETAYGMSSIQGISATITPSGVETNLQAIELNLSISLTRE